MPMNIENAVYAITKKTLCEGLDKACTSYKVAALINKEGKTLYDYIDSSKDIEFKYTPTILSPKKFFFPQEEAIAEYTSDGKVTAKVAAVPQVLFGIRPCDLNGIKIMNEAFAEGHGDPNYLAKLEQTVVIGMECCKICDQHAFCYKVDAHNATAGFDVMLYGCGCKDDFTAKAVTSKGKEFVEKYFSPVKGEQSKIDQFMQKKQEEFGKQKPFKDLQQFPDLFAKNKKHPIWDQEGQRCLSCGSCIMVCPTCYCFDVIDDTELNLKKGARNRKWDACMLSSFAVVTGGENFRHAATARLHHRINRKFEYLMRKHGQPVCVGCGRCVRACLAEISPKTIAEAINGEKA